LKNLLKEFLKENVNGKKKKERDKMRMMSLRIRKNNVKVLYCWLKTSYNRFPNEAI